MTAECPRDSLEIESILPSKNAGDAAPTTQQATAQAYENGGVSNVVVSASESARTTTTDN